jgi:uncharacterized damage-inducible protein DinB
MTPNELGTAKQTQRTLVKARLTNVRRWLDSALRRVTPELMEWAPAEGMRTVAGQLVEIIAVETPLVPRLKEGRQLSDPEVDAIIGDQHSLENLRRALIDVRQGTLAYLDSLSDDELCEEIPSGEAWFGTLWLPTMPRAEHFLNIAEHEFYHTGQLISYLWCHGDDPYKW